MTDSLTLAARSSRVDATTAFDHRWNDPEFAEQWAEACRHAYDLLEARAFQLSVEGNLEPVYYMGVIVDYVRKFDSKLMIEMLRAKRPEIYKTPGVNVNVAAQGSVFVLTEAERKELQKAHRELLADIDAARAAQLAAPPGPPAEASHTCEENDKDVINTGDHPAK